MNTLEGGGGRKSKVFVVLPERVKTMHNFAAALLPLLRVRDTSNLHESRHLNNVTNVINQL